MDVIKSVYGIENKIGKIDMEVMVMAGESYYYNQLNKVQQAVYHAMKNGLQALAPSFQVPLLEGRELSDIYFMLRLDCPEIFYTVKFKYRHYPDSGNAEIFPEYLFDKNKIRAHQKAMKSRVEKLARPALKLSEAEKEQYIIGPLGQGVGVCEGIAKSVKILCDALGIWCIVALSEANPEKGIKYRHTWNVVRIGGKYYHLDVTFDNTLGGGERLRYDYFNLSDKQIFRDHEMLVWKIPSCEDGDHFYYKEKKVSFTKTEDVRKRSDQAVKKGKMLIFHWRGGYLTKEVLTELLQIIEEEASKKERHAKVSLNWPQAVLQVTFEKELEGEPFTMEEANEGERE